MPPLFTVRSTPGFERPFGKLLKAHPELRAIRERVGEILETDPYNHGRAHHIKKLEAVPRGEGQWRLSLGRFRFRYDIYGNEVVLQYGGLRREDTYR
jgi:mRNA-degrading endonuclease RelE of RelBE toxin-antitoxin system